jgi:hypothetical protein
MPASTPARMNALKPSNERAPLRRLHLRQHAGKPLATLLIDALDNLATRVGQHQPHLTPVARVRHPPNQRLLLQAMHHVGRRRVRDVQPLRQVAHRDALVRVEVAQRLHLRVGQIRLCQLLQQLLADGGIHRLQEHPRDQFRVAEQLFG